MEFRSQLHESNPQRSPYEVLARYEVATFTELDKHFTELDQTLYTSLIGCKPSDSLDLYCDREHKLTTLKNTLLEIDTEKLHQDDLPHYNEMLWLWNHHAAGIALFGPRDRESAYTYAEQALNHQSLDHPNKITELIYLLSQNEYLDAENYIATFAQDDPERLAAESALATYHSLYLQ